MNRFLFLFLASLWLMGCPNANNELASSPKSAERPIRKNLIPDDHTYETNIRSVQLYQGSVEESYPILVLGTTEFLTLEFDELMPEDQRESDFFVDIVNCDVNWEPTNVLPIEFYEGFPQDRIELFQRSEFTKVPYVHQWYQFPQEKEFFKMSGNYLLKVYRNNNQDDLILTRRFIVVEKRLPIQLKYQLSGRMERMRFTDFSFEVATGSENLLNPSRDLQVQVLQNFRWDNRVLLPLPRFQADNRLEYYLNVPENFPGGNEFRRLMLSSTRFFSEAMQSVEERENIFDIYLFADKARTRSDLGGRRDRNGSYGIRVQEWPNPDQQADYVRSFFFLQADEPAKDAEVYVFGRFSDWQMHPSNRLDYNEVNRRYEGDIILKQGIYDYEYVVKYPNNPLPDEVPFEGAQLTSENFYTILIYFRGPTDRTDRLIGYQPINYID